MKVGVVILNYKVKDLTVKCINSVKKSTFGNAEIIVVDNNSEDCLVEEMKDFPDVIFISNKENLGYCGGNNVGIKKALADGSEIVLILNADTTIGSLTIEKLVAVVEKEDVGVAGPKILFGDKKILWYAGGIFDCDNVLGKHRGVDETDRGQYDLEEETDYISGAAMMIKKEVFEKIGFFDERYFLYYEDSDFCFRAKRAGFNLIYVPKAEVYHENAKSTGLGSSLQDYFITRNRMLFAAKFLPFRTRFALFREALKNVFNPVRRMAFLDFLAGNFGKGSYLK